MFFYSNTWCEECVLYVYTRFTTSLTQHTYTHLAELYTVCEECVLLYICIVCGEYVLLYIQCVKNVFYMYVSIYYSPHTTHIHTPSRIVQCLRNMFFYVVCGECVLYIYSKIHYISSHNTHIST